MKDHLGNTRVIFTEDGPDADSEPDILQEADYYPFGMTHSSPTATNHYLFNGIERQEDLNLNVDMAHFRTYDYAIGRWWQTDPRYDVSVSSYSGFGNNPIVLTDMLGDTTNYYNIVSGEYLGTLFGNQNYNDRLIDADTYKKIVEEKYLNNHITIGRYNIYFHDITKSFGDYLTTSELEEYINNSDNLPTTQLDLDSDLGKLARIGFAEFRGSNETELEAGIDITKNRLDANYRGAQTMDDVLIPSQYSSLRKNDHNKPFYDNPYVRNAASIINHRAWIRSVSAAIKVNSGNSGITKGALHYYSPMSMPKNKVPKWVEPKKEVIVPGIRKRHMKIYKNIK